MQPPFDTQCRPREVTISFCGSWMPVETSKRKYIRASLDHVFRSILLGVLALALVAESGCHAEQPWPLWERYTQSVLDVQGRVVDHVGGDRTTSEGQAYGLFFALVDDDRTHFDKILNWTEANLAGGDLTLRLPAWSWGKNVDGSWKIIDPNPASDADLWLAFDLLEAGRLWREPRYEKLGTIVLSRISQTEVVEVPGLGTTLLPGPTGFHSDPNTWLLNPSYLPPQVLARLACAMPEGPWKSILTSMPQLLRQGSGSGFAMDWIAAGGSIRPSLTLEQISSGDRTLLPVGSYDAIRVYLWLGMADPDTPNLRQFFGSTSGMATYLKSAVTPPLKVDSAGKILDANAPVGFSAAVIPYLHALGMKAQERDQITRVAALKDPGSGLYGKQAAYYDQNLVLFATGWMEGRFRFDRVGKLVLRWK